jgi:hypothetical protein
MGRTGASAVACAASWAVWPARMGATATTAAARAAATAAAMTASPAAAGTATAAGTTTASAAAGLSPGGQSAGVGVGQRHDRERRP